MPKKKIKQKALDLISNEFFSIPFLPKPEELLAITSGNLGGIRKLKSTLESLKELGLAESPAAKKTIEIIEKIVIKQENRLEKERIEQLRDDYTISQNLVNQEMREQKELDEQLKVLRVELEGFFEKHHKELQEIKDRAEKFAEIQRQLDVVRASLLDIREKITTKRAQVAAINVQLVELLPQVAAAKIVLAEKTTQILQKSGLLITDQETQELVDGCIDGMEEHLSLGGTIEDFQLDNSSVVYKKFESLLIKNNEVAEIVAKKADLMEKFKEYMLNNPKATMLFLRKGELTREGKRMAREIIGLTEKEEKAMKEEKGLMGQLGIVYRMEQVVEQLQDENELKSPKPQ